MHLGRTTAALLLLALAWPADAQDYSRLYNAPRATEAVVVDGDLSDAAWSQAPWTDDYILYGTLGVSTDTRTRAKIAWDADYLYVAVEAEDRDIWSTHTARDAPLYNEDVVEFFLDPEGDAHGYMEFEVSPRNTIFDSWIENPLFSGGGPSHVDWNASGLVTAVRIDGTVGGNNGAAAERADTDAKWVMEAALPWPECAVVSGEMALPPNPGDTWRMNVMRYDYGKGDPELSQWSPSARRGAWHEPGEYGFVTFVAAGTAVAPASWGRTKARAR